MKAFWKCYIAEFIKPRRTLFYPLHLIIPLLLTLAVSLLAHSRGVEAEGKLFTPLIFQAIGIAMPLVSSVVCGLVCEREAQAGNYRHLLASPYGRVKVLAAQLAVAMTMCAFALTLAVTGALTALTLWGGGFSLSILECAALGGMLWLSAIPLYAFHLWAGYRWGIGICSIFGFLGVIIASLGTTRMFDPLWPWLPPSWGVRLTEMWLLDLNMHLSDARGILLISAAVLAWTAVWVTLWEGRSAAE